MKKWLGVLSGLALLALGSMTYMHDARGVNIPLVTGPLCTEPGQQQACINQFIQTLNTQLGNTPAWSTPRNFIDNGAFNIQQRGTGATTCATTSTPTTAAYAADRWFCDVNVTSGAGAMTIITTTPAPPPGFAQSMKLVRSGGALLQPQCAWHILPTSKAVALQGQQVTFSVYEQALAGLAADQTTGQSFNLVIITGTSADESPTTWTASPALTPAWTGIATAVNQNFPTPATPAWARYQVSAPIPLAAKEVGVGICWTPTAAGQSATDGIAFVGAQLEQGAVATPYEFKNIEAEYLEAARYYYQLNETSGVATMRGSCVNLTSSISNCMVPFPVPMRKVPTMAYATGFAIAVAAQTSVTSCTANATSTTATSLAGNQSVLMSCATSAAGGALGTATTWGDNNGSGNITAFADL
jgi:hypothetical protein